MNFMAIMTRINQLPKLDENGMPKQAAAACDQYISQPDCGGRALESLAMHPPRQNSIRTKGFSIRGSLFLIALTFKPPCN